MFAQRRLLVVFVSGICALLPAALLGAGSSEPAKADQVDPSASRVFIKVGSATALGHPHGIEGQLKSGKVTFGGDGELVFDMNSFTADTAESHKRTGLEGEKTSSADAKKITDTMRGKEVLDTARFPTATFHMNAVTPLDQQAPGAPGMYQLNGKFTLHRTEKDLQIKAKLEAPPDQKSQQLKLTGSFKIKQSDYGIKPYSTFGGAAKVSDELEIIGDLLLKPVGK